MTSTVIKELGEFGQSIWLDYISRPLIEGGGLQSMIGFGLRGMTSNPTIFDKAISSTFDYDEKIVQLSNMGKSTFDIYDILTIKDIQDAADIFFPVYKTTEGLDGYVSLEVNPNFAHKINETIEEARRLHREVNCPNVMFKIPATDEGFKAVEELVAEGININVTLIFSLQQYINTAYAYISGIKRFIESGGDAKDVRSVASVFVSRIDTAVDNSLDQTNCRLKGKVAEANSRIIYKKFLDIFCSDEYKELRSKGCNLQRVLWGSTGTKNPAYSDIKYVTELIGKDTVNTAPQATIEAFLDHGKVVGALGPDIAEAQSVIDEIEELGIKIDDVCSKLLKDGVTSFERSFESLLENIKSKAKKLSEGVSV